MPLFGLLIPWPPPYVLWALIILDVALTFVPGMQKRIWPMALLILLSLYLAYAGMFTIGILFLILIVVQAGLLLRSGRSSRRHGA